MKIIVIYYSQGGATKKMAEIIASHMQADDVEVDLRPVEEVHPKMLLEYNGILIGSPTYYGTCAYQIKKLLDESVQFHGKLDGKAGGAFSSAANVAGGNETTVLSILEALLIHGIVVQGDPKGDHYGPVAIGNPDKRAEVNCRRFAERFVQLVQKLQGNQ